MNLEDFYNIMKKAMRALEVEWGDMGCVKIDPVFSGTQVGFNFSIKDRQESYTVWMPKN